ncbi:MAG: hypothetical protein ACI89X_002340 [Planctomycetota bacterium]
MNPGRAPTPVGGDGILPFVDVPHWFVADVARVLRSHRVDYQLRPAYIRRVGSDNPDDHLDRFVFQFADPKAVQSLLDSIKPDGCG